MKKFFVSLTFIVAYTAFLSIGVECLLMLLGVAMAISLDGSAVTEQYPRFIPFCLATGSFALIALIATFVINIKVSDRLGYTQREWQIQAIAAIVASVPMIQLWETLFEFLQRRL